MNKPIFSICIPIHAMERGDFFLTRCLDSILDQTFTDYEVVITDNSDDDKLKKVFDTYAIKRVYYRNPKKGMAPNTNEAMKRANGRLVKILYMDDYFAHKNALKDILEAFTGYWLITAVDNNLHPRYTTNIHMGNNHLGSPSALTIQRDKVMFFDEELSWLLDCDLYRRLYDKYGEPVILNKVNVNMGVHPGQMTNILSDDEKKLEEVYLLNKYD